ncbi:MAG: c-type cytochrome [Betaproteobacteria bacterium]|nr:c-type cytochrome [Betaproteobacteria bacterium]
MEERARTCYACHGENGISGLAEIPSLGGQPSFFLMTQLFLLREGRRGGAPMIEVAKSFSDDDLRAWSEFFSRLPPPPGAGAPDDPPHFARAEAIARRGHCGVCHNPDFSGREQMPRLANQREDYLLKAMREFRSGARLGYGAAMTAELFGMSDQDLADLAYYFANQPRRNSASGR